jgi:DNA-binding beta-propeller fold protein YncE
LISVGLEPEGIVVDNTTGTIAVALRGSPPGLDLLAAASGQLERFVALDGAARHLGLGPTPGTVLVPNETDDRVDVVSLPSGTVISSVKVGRQPHDVVAVGSEYVDTDELANTIHIVAGGTVRHVEAAPIQPGGIAADSYGFVVVGVRGRVIEAYRPDGSVIARALCGAGPTHVVAGPGGYFYVADTNGGALLVFDLDGSSLRQVGRVALGPAPYGIASDPATGWVYVTLTGSNQLVGLHFQGAKVTSRRLWPTGRQPNSVAVDQPANAVVVTATGSDQLELIPLPSGADATR